jgi:hypothetical protein
MLLTNLTGLAKRNKPPQKARPNPIKAKTLEEAIKEAKRTIAPLKRNPNPILFEGIFSDLSGTSFSGSLSPPEF